MTQDREPAPDRGTLTPRLDTMVLVGCIAVWLLAIFSVSEGYQPDGGAGGGLMMVGTIAVFAAASRFSNYKLFP